MREREQQETGSHKGRYVVSKNIISIDIEVTNERARKKTRTFEVGITKETSNICLSSTFCANRTALHLPDGMRNVDMDVSVNVNVGPKL